MICQACGNEAPTKYVAFYQNIGVLVMRFSKSIKGELCKSCIHKHYWQYTLINMTLGWWGMISLIVTPFFVLNNTFRYAFCLGMDPVPPDAEPPRLTEDAMERLKPHMQDLFDRINDGEKLPDAVRNVSDRAGVTPGQTLLFLQAIVRQNAQ
jgi:hypothetical protein